MMAIVIDDLISKCKDNGCDSCHKYASPFLKRVMIGMI